MEPKPNDIQYMGSAQYLSASHKQAIETGVQWVRDWYIARAHETGLNGKPYLTEEQLSTVLHRLDNLRIYCGHDPLGELIHDLQQGTTHFTPESLKQADTNTLLSSIHSERGNPNILGAHASIVSEPHICLNATAMDSQIKQFQAGRRDDRPYSLTEITIHELTHLVETNPKEMEHIEQIHAKYAPKTTGIFDPLTTEYSDIQQQLFQVYSDSPIEVHARMNVMRYQFGISPSQHVEYEDLLHMQSTIQQTKEAAPQLRNQLTPEDIYGNGPVQNMPTDQYLINSYPLPELKSYFNEVSQDTTRDRLLDEEHREAHPDRGETRQPAQRPHTQSQLQQQSHRGRSLA